MTTHRDLLQSVIENPDDLAPRLVFADWLEEQGEQARAELIRVQCEMKRLRDNDYRGTRSADYEQLVERQQSLLHEHRSKWIEKGPRRVRFDGGLLSVEATPASFFTKSAGIKWWEKHRDWVSSICLRVPARKPEFVEQLPPDMLDRVTYVWHEASEKGYTEETLRQLTRITGLRQIRLQGHDEVTAEALHLLLQSPRLKSLECISIIDDHLPFLLEVIASRQFKLQWLQFRYCSIDWAALEPLREVPTLWTLVIESPQPLESLWQISGLTQLRRLSLQHCQISVNDLAQLEGLDHLQKLEINGVKWGEDGLKHLASLQSLERLSLVRLFFGRGKSVARCDLTKKLPHLENLRELIVPRIEFSAKDMQRLVENCPNLKHLNLDSSTAEDAAWKHLKQLHGLRRLHIGMNSSISIQTVNELKEANPDLIITYL